MAVLDNEPVRLTQGESVTFQKTFPSYPSSSWICVYYFRGPASLDKVASPVTGGAYQVTLSSEETAQMKAGSYRYQAFVSNLDNEKHLVSQGSLEVLKNISTTLPCEGESTNLQNVVDALNASIIGLATQNQLEVIVGNVQVRYMSLDEKIRAHQYFSRLLANEQNQQALEDGMADGSGGYRVFGRTIYTRFRNP